MATSLLFNLALVLVFSITLGAQIETASLEDAMRQVKPPVCGGNCLFRFCMTNENINFAPAGRRLIMRDPESAVNPFICRTDGTAGRIFRVGQAMIQEDEETLTPISNWSPAGLSPLLPRNFFGVGIIPSLRKSGLTRMPTTVDQYKFLDGRCVIMPIRAYEEVDPATGARIRRRRTRRPNDCVSFQTIAPKMAIELFWQSSDDFDLSVTEPDGDVLDRRHPRTELGRFNNDNGSGACEPPRVHHENAIYLMPATLETGEYTINVRHFRNCGNGSTRYAVRVLIDGVKVFEQFGRSNNMRRRIVDTLKFTV